MKKPVILVVDDSKPILCLLKVVLGKRFNVFAASDGFGAMNWLMEGNRPDVVVSDLQMPNIDGIELISYLSSSSYYEGIPILVLSGADQEEVTEHFDKTQITDYVTKPFDPAELINKIDRALDKTEQGQSANGSFLLL
jgi:two-component system chemotaxis response regulator CheY